MHDFLTGLELAGWPLLAQQEQQGPGLMQLMLPLAVILLLYVLLIQRPQRRDQAMRQDMLKNLKKNDRVITNGGIYGVVTNVQADADEVTLRVDETNNTRLRMSLGSIARVLTEPSKGGDETSST